MNERTQDYTTYTVSTVNTVFSVYDVYTVDTLYAVSAAYTEYTVFIAFTVFIVFAVYTTCTAYAVCSVYTDYIYAMSKKRWKRRPAHWVRGPNLVSSPQVRAEGRRREFAMKLEKLKSNRQNRPKVNSNGNGANRRKEGRSIKRYRPLQPTGQFGRRF